MLHGVDALTTDLKNVCIGVKTADCIPVLIYEERMGVIAAVHAGWKGTVQRIVEKNIDVLKEYYGIKPENLKAVIGPGISLESFEVGNEVYEEFEKAGFPMGQIARMYAKKLGLPYINFYTQMENERSYVIGRIRKFLN